jgi:hypothetical protein
VFESVTPLQNHNDTPDSERTVLVRRHAVLVTEWETVQNETDVLKEESKGVKWLMMFRTVTEQADRMVGSLEKVADLCQVRSRLFFMFHTLILGPRIYGKYTREVQTIFFKR